MKSVTVTKMLMLMAMKKLFNCTEIPPLIVLSYFVFVLSLSLSLSLLPGKFCIGVASLTSMIKAATGTSTSSSAGTGSGTSTAEAQNLEPHEPQPLRTFGGLLQYSSTTTRTTSSSSSTGGGYQ